MTTSQALISGTLLLAIRQTEAQRGTLLAHYGRAEHALRPTVQRKVRFNPERRARKLRARYIAHVNALKQHHTGGGITGLIDFKRGEFVI